MTMLIDAHHARSLQAARDALELYYRAARELVYDVVPAGPIDEAALSAEQHDALHRLREAESHLDSLRHY